MSEINKALVKAQKGFAPALKTSTNPHFKSKYAALDACIEAVIDSLNNNGIALVQKTKPCDSGVIVETVFLHESGESLSCGELHVPASKLDAQGYGSALTYARRYSLMAACGIAPEDDDGNAASNSKHCMDAGAVADFCSAMEEADSVEALESAYKKAAAAAKQDNDAAAFKRFGDVARKMKAKLGGKNDAA